MNKKRLLALDIGGTAIKYAVYEDGLSETSQVKTPYGTVSDLIETIRKIVQEVSPIDGIGVSMPGTIDTKTGYIYQGGSLTYNAGVNFKDLLEKSFGVPASILNDAKAATLAEMKVGVLQNVQDGVVVLFGTGIGGGIVANGKILNGYNLQAGEFSYISTDIHTIKDPYTMVGTVMGKYGLEQTMEKASGLPNMSGLAVFEQIRAGNQKVLEGMKNFCDNAAWLFYNLQYILDPEVFAVGGGISAEPMFMDLLNESLDRLVKDFEVNGLVRPTLKVCAHRNKANLLGAVFNFIDQHPEKS